MPPIYSLVLRDFQSHKKSTLDLHEGLNVIIGSSNSGKTSIVRAMALMLSGLWSKSFVRHGQKNVEVIFDYGNGKQICRTKGKANKVEIFFDDLPEAEEYSGFGDKLPDHVRLQFGSPLFHLDSDKSVNLNLALQHDPLFLLKETGTLNAKILGRLIGLHFIDMALRGLNTDSRNLSMRIGDSENQIADMKEKQKEFAQISEWKKEASELVDKIKKQKDIDSQLARVDEVLRSVQSYNANLRQYKEDQAKFDQIDPNQIREEFIQRLVDLKVCPTCGSEMDRKTAEACLEHA